MRNATELLLSGATIAIMAIIATSSVSAQSVAPDAAAPSIVVDQEMTEIVVTAQKRSERLSDVPISISAATGDQLVKMRVTDLAQLEKIAPGFTYRLSGYGTPILTIRGIGFSDTSVGVSPTVSVYLDQVPLPYSVMTRGVSLDLERVEVLKGPQGTLFGQNSTGGAINYIAAKPTQELSGSFSLDYGRFNSINAEAVVSGGLTANLRMRVAARYEYRDPWQTGYAPNDQKFGKTGNEELGRRQLATGRVLVDWDASDRLTFELSANGWRDTSDTQAAQFRSFLPSAPRNPFNGTAYNAFGGAAPLQPLPDKARLAGWDANKDYARDDWFYQIALRGELQLGADMALTSLTGYSRYHQDSLVDTDGTSYAAQSINSLADIKAFSQELRLSGKVDQLRWMIGGNYAKESTNEIQTTVLGTTNNGIGPFRYGGAQPRSHQNVRTYAGFFSVDYDLNDQLTLQGSGRYTKQNRDYRGCLADPATDGRFALAFNNAFGINAVFGGCVTQQSVGVLLPIVTSSLDEDNLSWRGNISWKPSRDLLFYANITKGYKAGGYPVIPSVFASQLDPVGQESVLAYETGFKASVLHRMVDISGAAFYYDYKNKQLLGFALIPPFGNLPKLVNIPKSRAVGAELQATIRPVEGLRLSGGVTFVDTKVQRDPANPTNPYGAVTSFVGEAFPNTPRWQGTLDAEYRLPVGGETEIFFGASTTSRSGSHSAFGDTPTPAGILPLAIPGYTLLDLRAGIEGEGGMWRFQIWGRNVTNKFYVTGSSRLADVVQRTTGMPATYGATASFRY